MADGPDNVDPRTAALLQIYAPQIRTQETGSKAGDYGNVGPKSRTGDQPYGAYQIMGANVGPWTEKYLGKRLTPQEFLNNPAAQDAVFQGEFGRLVAKHGPAGAAVAWHGGEGGLTNPGAADVLGKTNAAYGHDFLTAIGMPPTAGGAPAQPQPGAGVPPQPGAPVQPPPMMPAQAQPSSAQLAMLQNSARNQRMSAAMKLISDGFTPKAVPTSPLNEVGGLLSAFGGFGKLPS